MKAAVFYASREGHTRKVAARIAADLRAHGLEVDVHDLRELRTPVEWTQYALACVAASVHAGHHEPEAIAFVRRTRDDLARLGAVFVSVTLSEAGAEDLTAPPERRAQAAAGARRMIDVFVAETGWQPARSLPVAGALAYSRYNPLVRFVMKRIARKQGTSTDTSRDHEFTNWPALDRFVGTIVEAVSARIG